MNRILTLSISVFVFSFLGCLNGQTQAVKTDLTAREFDKKIKELDNEVIVDVRSSGEFVDGAIPEAVNIDWNGKYWTQVIAGLDKNKPYLLYCYSGGRSTDAAEAMRKAGFKDVYNLDGGIEAWRKAELPEVKQNPLRGN
jgi:rhodanese-related sulfurtransferase